MEVFTELYVFVFVFSLLSACTASVEEELRDIKVQLTSLDTRLVQQRTMRRQENEAIDNKLDKILFKLDNIHKVLQEVKLTGGHTETTVHPLLALEEPQTTDHPLLALEEPQTTDQTSTCSRRSASKPTLTHLVLWDNVQTLCDSDTDCGGWVIIQRRSRGDVNFYRSWADYKNGFGTPDSDYWLGLDTIHNLTTQGYTDLRIDMQFQGARYFAHYSNFSVGPASSSYQLSMGQYYGTAGDSLKFHNGSLFSTLDVDNDKLAASCAELYHGGWWYANCYHSNLNGLWATNNHNGVVWRDLGSGKSLSLTEMKIRRPSL